MVDRVTSSNYKEVYLFILSVDLLGKAIRANDSIKGISVNCTEIKISRYADDTTLILNGTQESLSAVLDTTISALGRLNLNYIEKANKIRNVLSCWNYRRLTNW